MRTTYVLETARQKLLEAIRNSGGHKFNHQRELFPKAYEDMLLKELLEAGWDHKLVANPDGFRFDEYYEIFPKE